MATPIEQTTSTPAAQAPTTGPAGKTYTEDDLAKVRQQEKDKLYKELETLRGQVETLSPIQQELERFRKEQEERLAIESEARQKAEEEARAKRESEMSAKELLEARQKEWEEKFQEMQAEREREKLIVEKEREFAQLRDYAQARIAQEKDNIAPELLDLVDGSTREEIDASIERMKVKSAAIAEKVRGTTQQFAAQQQGVTPSGFSSTGPMDMLPTTQQWSAEEIAAMSAKEFAEKVRPHFIGRGDSARNRGLFG
jgi:hypothetical protein